MHSINAGKPNTGLVTLRYEKMAGFFLLALLFLRILVVAMSAQNLWNIKKDPTDSQHKL
jgi:hypothetical protein